MCQWLKINSMVFIIGNLIDMLVGTPFTAGFNFFLFCVFERGSSFISSSIFHFLSSIFNSSNLFTFSRFPPPPSFFICNPTKMAGNEVIEK